MTEHRVFGVWVDANEEEVCLETLLVDVKGSGGVHLDDRNLASIVDSSPADVQTLEEKNDSTSPWLW